MEEECDVVQTVEYEERKPLDGVTCKAWLAVGHKTNKGQADEGVDGDDRGLMAEVYDIIMVDWQTWFGTLCVLLWLLFLIII